MNITNRPRRLRENESIRRLTRETRLSPDALILPFFVREGHGIVEEIPSLPGQIRYSPDTLCNGVEAAMQCGVRSFLLFGIPEKKDERGSAAWDENGVLQSAVRNVKSKLPQAFLITDVCLCGYTDHGHCGVVHGQTVDNDKTLPLLATTALSHVKAGADMVAPSDMMDGRVGVIRAHLDANGFAQTPIMSYAAKFASSFYGPFREAAGSAPGFGDRKGYQMDYHNVREAVFETLLDVDQGADILMVKPALAYLDVIRAVTERIVQPVAAYSVSGEYAMIKSASQAGSIDEYGAMCESAVSIFRAGANILITYFAKELAAAILKGDIG